ncbi:MAG: hypothetical protein JWO73_518 [Candidatus Taylorbacteria bacterium]|nr:hypothetical protein [Candidatus Taylorbacteria bacterium]
MEENVYPKIIMHIKKILGFLFRNQSGAGESERNRKLRKMASIAAFQNLSASDIEAAFETFDREQADVLKSLRGQITHTTTSGVICLVKRIMGTADILVCLASETSCS